MTRKMYEPTQSQIAKWARSESSEMPSDEEFKARGKRERRPWGIIKRDYILSKMAASADYQRGIWQGRVDKARGLEYSEERNDNTYNLGYYRGYTEYESNRRGWDNATRERFDSEYVNC